VFLITLDPLLSIRNPTLVFVLIGTIDNVLFSFLHLIQIRSEVKIVNYICAKHKLECCCLQCFVIGASNSLVNRQLIEGSNQMEYFLVLLD
jgi:hypothetical protein